MTILASLNKAYARLEGAAPFGYSQEKIGFVISLNEDGTVANFTDMRLGEGKKKTAPLMQVPQPTKRTAGIAPNFLWDKSSYVLGVTAGEGKRVLEEHAAFKNRHLKALADVTDVGLVALYRFLNEFWAPEKFAELGWPEDIKDQNLVFALDAERLSKVYLHNHLEAKAIWERLAADGEKTRAVCLVTGEQAPIARLHPGVKGVWGGQSSGGSIVSFNLDAFTSYGHEQGDNAPVSEGAAFAYTTVLNKYLETGSKNRTQIGDASTVFWADASETKTAELAESVFGNIISEVDESTQSALVKTTLSQIRSGMPLSDIAPQLEEDVRFYVLGLAPNAARLSIRYWFDDDFGVLARNISRYAADMYIDPPPREPHPALWKYLAETAVLGKRENVPANLAGEWLRSILSGTRYPQTLFATVLMRLRADKNITALRVQILKAILIRNFNVGIRMSLDLKNQNKGYILGRLFAAYEQGQRVALGDKVNATIKDKFYGSASAQPRKVFGLLDKGSANHISKAKKNNRGLIFVVEKTIEDIMESMEPGDHPFPASLSAEQQALFAVGYYHQRSEFFKSKQDRTPESDGVK